MRRFGNLAGPGRRQTIMKWITFGILVLMVSACSPSSDVDATTTSQPAATVITVAEPVGPVVTIVDEGGCFMMGPNCATYRVYTDGTVELTRTGGSGAVEATTTVDVKLVDAIRDLVATEDLEALRAGLPEGEMTAAYDGVDTSFIYAYPQGDVAFASAVVELVASEPLFAATWKIRDLAAGAMDLPLQTRP